MIISSFQKEFIADTKEQLFKITGDRRFTIRKRNINGPNAQEIEVEEIVADRWAINHERISFQTDSRVNNPKPNSSFLEPHDSRVMSNSFVGTRVTAEDFLN